MRLEYEIVRISDRLNDALLGWRELVKALPKLTAFCLQIGPLLQKILNPFNILIVLKCPEALENFLEDRTKLLRIISQNILYYCWITKALLEFLEGGEVEVDAGALYSLRKLQALPRRPIIFSFVLFDLVAAAVVDQADFVAADFEDVGRVVPGTLFPDFFEGASHGFDAVDSLQLRLNNLLINYIPLSLIDYKKDPGII